jgi:hypothetical protein
MARRSDRHGGGELALVGWIRWRSAASAELAAMALVIRGNGSGELVLLLPAAAWPVRSTDVAAEK